MRNDLEKRLTNHDPAPTTSGSDRRVHDDAVVVRGRGTRAGNGAGAPAKLRRWSVAELLARAVPRPPAGGIAH